LSTFRNELGANRKILWIASAGGHLEQALRIELNTGVNRESLWLTFDTPQTRSRLANRRHEFIPYVAPRDMRGAIRSARRAAGIAEHESFDLVASTGAGVALFALPLLAQRGLPAVFIDSVTRAEVPSTTGCLLALTSKVRTLTQHEQLASRRWDYAGSVLSGLRSKATPGSLPPRRFFVTLGSIQPYRFDRAVDAVLRVLRPTDEVVWQLGATTRDDLPGIVHDQVSQSEMRQFYLDADVVLTHAGIGSLILAAETGTSAMVMVRSRRYREHVDDHQRHIADYLLRAGVVREFSLEDPRRRSVEEASRSALEFS